MPPRPSPIPLIGGAGAAPPQGGHIAGLQATGPGLRRSTLKAGGVAAAILALFYLPAEYGVDPTGIGGLLGLTEMGEIKSQLAAEAEADGAATAASPMAAALPTDLADRLARIEGQVAAIAAVVGAGALPAPETAPPPAAEPVAAAPEAPLAAEAALAALAPPEAQPAVPQAAAPQPAGPGWRDEATATLAPGEGVEIKLLMQEGEVATFEWSANGGVLNHATHGDDGAGREISYEDGRAVPVQAGELTAAFTGNHGWFWRNRTDEPVTLTLRTGGAYEAMIR